MATSSEPLMTAFQNQFDSDQYGGLLSLSAAVYRYLSPDVHRPLLILIMAAFAGAVGIPFLYKAVKERWGKRPALIAGWIMVLYPESIMLGGSEMREPFLLALISILFWAVLSWKKIHGCLVGGCGQLAVPVPFLVAGGCGGGRGDGGLVLAGLCHCLVEYPLAVLGWGTVGVASVLLAVLSWEWLHGSASYDTSLVEQSSGMVELIMNTISHAYRIPLTLSGLAQPVLPAAWSTLPTRLHRLSPSCARWDGTCWHLCSCMRFSPFGRRRTSRNAGC